jgi:hypothetical protein
MGLGPSVLPKSDICVVLYGGDVPFILRQRDGVNSFAGEYYV